MSEQRKRISEALRVCAETGVPETAAPWPEIRDRALAGRRSRRRSPRRSRFVPRTRSGLAFAALLLMLFGAVGFAATGWINELFEDFAPEVQEANLGVQLNEKQTVDGITFTLERAYADEDNVVVGYSIEGFEDWSDRYPTTGLSVVTDGSDGAFEYVGGGGMGTDPVYDTEGGESLSDLAFFEPSNKLDPSAKHGFRFELKPNPKAERGGGQDGSPAKAADKTLVFDFGIPVHEVDVIEAGQTVEANGIPITLERVENSPARTEAILCFDPPRDDEYTWIPVVPRPDIAESDVFSNESLYGAPPEEEIGCVGYDLFRSIYDEPGRHTLTVTRIEGRSPSADDPRLMVLRERIAGPWTFEFEVPER